LNAEEFVPFLALCNKLVFRLFRGRRNTALQDRIGELVSDDSGKLAELPRHTVGRDVEAFAVSAQAEDDDVRAAAPLTDIGRIRNRNLSRLHRQSLPKRVSLEHTIGLGARPP
jgi:hypothetical protein